jgi:restriction endonuclease Mrr
MVAVDYRQLMQPALDRLERAGGELGFDELLQEVASALNLDEDAARSPLASGRETHLANNLRWALSYLAADGKLQVAGNGSLVRSAGSSGFRETPAAFGEPLHPTSLNGKPAEFAVCAHPVDDGGDSVMSWDSWSAKRTASSSGPCWATFMPVSQRSLKS